MIIRRGDSGPRDLYLEKLIHFHVVSAKFSRSSASISIPSINFPLCLLSSAHSCVATYAVRYNDAWSEDESDFVAARWQFYC